MLANFPLFCGVDPPVDVAAHDEDDPDDIDPAQAEQELFALINNDRRAAGLLPLVWDNRLAAIARSHSRDMAENRFIAHVSPTTGDTETRVRKAGGRYDLVLENVGQEGGVRQAHQGFMHSPGHRANVLNQHATFIGIGVVVNHPRQRRPADRHRAVRAVADFRVTAQGSGPWMYRPCRAGSPWLTVKTT